MRERKSNVYSEGSPRFAWRAVRKTRTAMRTSFLLAVAWIAVVVGACAVTPEHREPPAEDGRIGTAASAIINGQPDTTHQAVVAIVLQSGSQGGLCSGTIVKTDPVKHIGWVLAAAHCVELPPVYVLQADDFSQVSQVLKYDVIDYNADSRYGGMIGSPYDFAVIRIAGVDATTPTIPLASANDGLTVGTNVVSVGYGRTSLIASGAGTENTVRRRVEQDARTGRTRSSRTTWRRAASVRATAAGPCSSGAARPRRSSAFIRTCKETATASA